MPLFATDHYENFPVGSVLLPRRLRTPIGHIYRFARTADDIADEGVADAETRLQSLNAYRRELDIIEAGRVSRDVHFAALAETIARHHLPVVLFRDLLDAFAQDVIKQRYANFSELLDYCRRSADPVGRLLLHLFEQATPRNLLWSDAICSSLQLINFWQDIAIDWRNGRVYLPADDMAAHGVTEAHIASGQVDARWQSLLRFELARTRAMLDFGAPLGRELPGRFGLEIRAIIASGRAILNRIEAVNGDVFRRRPTLKPTDWPFILARAIRSN